MDTENFYYFSKKQFLPISEWDQADRPREKFMDGKSAEMSNEELLAILIGSGTGSYSALDIAQKILRHFDGNLSELSRRSPKELVRKFNGIGQAKAVSILAGLELGKRVFSLPANNDTLITSSQTAFQVLCTDLCNSPYEKFMMLLLAQNGRLIRKVSVSEGGMSSTTVDAKKIFKYAIDEGGCGLVLAHNHPSGNLRPSDEDIRITEKITEGARMLDLFVFDHLIINGQSFFSFADNGLVLPPARFSPQALVMK